MYENESSKEVLRKMSTGKNKVLGHDDRLMQSCGNLVSSFHERIQNAFKFQIIKSITKLNDETSD